MKLSIKAEHDRIWQFSLGGVAGILGGLTSLWGVPITIYLIIKRVKPRQFIDASGFLIFIGCIPLAIGYSTTGLLSPDILFLLLQAQQQKLLVLKLERFFVQC